MRFARQSVFICSTINGFVICLEGGLENSQKRSETRGKSLSKSSFHSSIDGAEERKQGRNKERKKTTGHLLCIFADVPGADPGFENGGHTKGVGRKLGN